MIDAVLKVDTPAGPCWHRYNHDGYGQRADGTRLALGVSGHGGKHGHGGETGRSDAEHVASLCADDWGLWRTITHNLEGVRQQLTSYAVDHEVVSVRLGSGAVIR